MKRTGGMFVLALLAGSGVVAAGCEKSDATSRSSSADVIDVSSGSEISLAVRGGIGPIISGQTLMKATVTMTDLELVADSGSTALSGNSFTVQLLMLQNELGQLFSQQSVKAGHYTAMRFRLKSASVETQDVNGALTVYASPKADRSQFAKGARVKTLDLGGLDSDGLAKCALAPGGIVVSGASSLAVQFALAQSLAAPSRGDWVLTPACWLVDQSTYASLDVEFEPADGASSADQDLSHDFQVMLLDSNMWPVSEVPIAASTTQSAATYGAHFADLAAFQGPFVAALIPPVDYALQSGVAFSVDLKPSASCSASISNTSLQVVSDRLLDVATDDHCSVVQRDGHGHVLAKTSQPIGPVEDVAPKTQAAIPQLPGNPAPM
ncbi:MAG TPA: DUF4382 domain-containing protein [Polyangiaceae bacterium]